jgi:hypothetical protein
MKQNETIFSPKILIFPNFELKENCGISRVKSVSKIQKWTKKMSNFQKLKHFMKKGYKFPPS